MNDDNEHIAIIGMACRFPGANDTSKYWQNLCEGIESISFFTEKETESCGVNSSVIKRPEYVRARGVLDNIEAFDASLFGFAPREAKFTDPQHRLFLECGWEALEDAGYNPRDYEGLIGVFAGSRNSSYLMDIIIQSDYWLDQGARDEAEYENFMGYLATRLSYKLQLNGPSVTLQTACSTSLVATHLACQSLLNYESDIALAGGVGIQVPQQKGYEHQPGGILSEDGHCCAFDQHASGTVFSNGAGLVVLKRLQDALDDGDSIDAVIIGSAINNDGGRKIGYTAPSVQAQSEVVSMAQAIADIEPEDVRMIEAHGTGTLLGDPIEVSALKKVFDMDKKNYCALGSVKSNIGHTDAAAGMAGLIKAAMAVKNGVIPPSINYEQPNSALELENSPFYINKECINWPEQHGSRIAGITSCGIGGTNAHVLVSQPPELEARKAMHGPVLMIMSAESESSLKQVESRLANHLQAADQINIKDIAYTMQVGRVPLTYRRAIVCQDGEDLPTKLNGESNRNTIDGVANNLSNSVAFMFPGQGSQYVNMGRDLYENVDIFRNIFDHCAKLLQPQIEQDIVNLLFVSPDKEQAASKLLSQTNITQPLLFVFEYALAKTWMEWGIKPVSFIGHSIGEYVAACLADVMTLEDALALVAERGRLIQSLPGGTMLAVSLSEDNVNKWLNDNIALAAMNAPELCVLSGEDDVINKLANELEAQGIDCRRLHTSHAFHSFMMDPILDSFRNRLENIELSPPRIPFISNVTGAWITKEQTTSVDYWVSHLRQTVRFSSGIQCLMNSLKGFLLEVGPGNTLSTLSRKQEPAAEIKIVPTVRHPNEEIGDQTFLYRSLAALWVEGCEVKWSNMPDAAQCRRVHLPTYPFERKRYWLDERQVSGSIQTHQTSGKLTDIDKWFYQSGWKRTPFVKNRTQASVLKKTWVLIAHAGEIAEALKTELASHNDTVIVAIAGSEFKKEGDQFTIDPSRKKHYDQLLSEISHLTTQFQFIYALNLTTPVSQALVDDYYKLLNLVQVIEASSHIKNVALNVLTKGAEDVLGNEEIDPGSSLIAGLARVNGQEHPGCFTRQMDVAIDEVSQTGNTVVKNIVNDLQADIAAHRVSYRNQVRWQPEYHRLHLSDCDSSLLRPEGVYLITGGLSETGLAMAQYLAEKVSARLILMARTSLPPRSEWDVILAGQQDIELSTRLKLILNIEEAGSVVHTVNADIACKEDVTTVLNFIKSDVGKLNGLIHAEGLLEDNAFKTISQTEIQDCETHFAPKVEGVKILQQVLEEIDLDFCMLVSSLSGQLGGSGSSVNSSANRFMDAVALQMHHDGYPWFSVNWDKWQIEPAAEIIRPSAEALAEHILTADEGKLVLDRIFAVAHSLPLIIVSTGDLDARYSQSVQLEYETAETETETERAEENLSNTFATNEQQQINNAPRNETERVLVEIWQDLLGLDALGIQDNFFEVGGDSLKGLRLTSHIRQQLNIELSINDIFKMPTIAELASSFALPDSSPESSDDDVDSLRQKIDQMTPEQISALLEKKRQDSKT